LLDPIEAIELDRRNFFELYYFYLIEYSILFEIIFIESLVRPLWYKLFIFYTEISISFLLNALFHTDDYIDEGIDIPMEKKVRKKSKYYLILFK
jgi:hypothetical protein